MILAELKKILIEAGLTAEDREKVDTAVRHINSAGFDDWGMNPETVKATSLSENTCIAIIFASRR